MTQFSRLLIGCFLLYPLVAPVAQAQWVRTSAPIGRVHRLVFDEDTLYAAYSGNSPALLGAHRSTDQGATWSSINTGLTGGQLEAFAFAFTDSGIVLGTGQGVFLSTNQGQGWTARNTGLPAFRTVSDFGLRGNNLYLAILEDAKAFLSTNSGLTWASRVELGPYTIVVEGPDMYATTETGIFKSTNDGTSWASISTGLPFLLSSYQLLSINDTLYISSNGEGVFRSTNDGASWEARNSGLSTSALSVISLAGDESNLLAGTFFDGVFLSTDRGASWTAINEGLTSMTVSWLVIKAPYAYAGANGVWRRLLSDFVTDVEDGSGSPDETAGAPARFTLGQNYPNPFNPSTTISFSLPQSEYATLRIFDVSGREVASLVSGVSGRLAAGTHQVVWDAAGQPSGVYYYRLEAGQFSETRKLLIVR